ncbi:hypothetical protein [Thioalkalivibrio sp. HK1]|uniref:hypothetical protein n=1 Tax=Thioalkalivibrio sp. HK1 TaxID=1469245 RepID=UPI0004724C59|nr:hypothetical protein [Thioalkalivibrio sp. HK1]
MSGILENLVSLVFVIGAGGAATYWIVRYVNATMDKSEERIVQYQQLKEEMVKGFEQIRQETAQKFEQIQQDGTQKFEQLQQEIAKNAQDNALRFEHLQQENAKNAQDNALRFEHLEEMIRNLQLPQGESRGSSESSNEKPESR